MSRALTTARGIALVLGVAALATAGFMLRGSTGRDPLTVRVERAPLVVSLTEAGTLRPAEALTYRSRVPGREIEVVWLVAEGAPVREGDAVVQNVEVRVIPVDGLKLQQLLQVASDGGGKADFLLAFGGHGVQLGRAEARRIMNSAPRGTRPR